AVKFHVMPPPTDEEIARLLTAIRARILRLLTRRGLGHDADTSSSDPLGADFPVLAGLSPASVQGRIALGPRAGVRGIALGRDPEARWVVAGGPRHAHLDGFDLHGNVSLNGEDRERLEQLCRYLLRPAVAQGRLRLTEDGRVVLELKTTWADGTSHLVFEPLDLLARLAALTPRPRVNLIFYHGLLGPNARHREAVVMYGGPPVVGQSRAANAGAPPDVLAPAVDVSAAPDGLGERATATPSLGRNRTWAQLMARAFEVDVLCCARCGGRLRLVATILDPRAIRGLLRSLGPSTEAPDRAPPCVLRG